MKKIFLIIIFPTLVFAKNDDRSETIKEYLKLHKSFVAESCLPGVEDVFLQLDKNYRIDGNFIPNTIDDKVDFKTIKNLIPLIKEKSIWIQSQIDYLKEHQDFRAIRNKIILLEKMINDLLLANEKKYFATNNDLKEKINQQAQVKFQELLAETIALKNETPFLLSFKFPVNHLVLRTEYEKYKSQTNAEAKNQANGVYLYRKIVQDGTFNSDLSKNDAVIRAAFDTLFLSLNKDKHRSFLTDIERVDFFYILKNFDKLLSFSPNEFIERLVEWKARNERMLLFYQGLVESNNLKFKDKGSIKDLTSLLENRARSLYILKDFVLSKEAMVYEFWSSQKELMQSLFAIESILYSEVGRLDSKDAFERKDVAQVIINRSKNAQYNQLGANDSLVKYLSPKIKANENHWLNVLFKEGEFSFTYFYIPLNFYLYCPDMSRIGQKLRKENVQIALDLLHRPQNKFKALRYFSRTGMFGRFEMDSLWSDFSAVPERPGKLIPKSKKLMKLIKLFNQDEYKFLYEFRNEDFKKNFLVIEILGKTYALDSKNKNHFYYYRNPHQFKYFNSLK